MNQFFLAPPHSAERARITGEILHAFDPYLKSIARHTWVRFRRLKGLHGLADIESAGREGLLQAIHRWHPDRSKPIVHLASVWISTTCKSEIRRQFRGAVDLPPKVRGLSRAYRALRDCGKASEAEDLLRSSGSRDHTCQIVRYLSQATTASLSLSILPPTETAWVSGNLSDDLDLTDVVSSIRQCLLDACSARDRLIFYLTHPDVVLSCSDVGAVESTTGASITVTPELAQSTKGNLSTIGKMLGVSRERIRQINQETFLKIRRRLGREMSR